MGSTQGRLKYTTYALIATFLASVITYELYNYYHAWLFRHKQATLDAVLEEKIKEIKNETSRIVNVSEKVAHSPELTSAMQSLVEKKSGFDIQSVQTFLKASLKDIAYNDVFLFSKDGIMILAEEQAAYIGKDFSKSPYLGTDLGTSLLLAKMTLIPSISYLTKTFTKNKVSYFVTIPLLFNEKFVGSIAIEIKADYIFDLRDSWKDISVPLEIDYGQEQNQMITIIRKNQKTNDVDFQKNALVYNNPFPLQEATVGNNGKGEKINFENKTVLASWTYQKDINMGVVVSMAKADVFSAAQPLLTVSYILAFLALLIGMYWVFLHQVSYATIRMLYIDTQDFFVRQYERIANTLFYGCLGIALLVCLLSWYRYTKMNIDARQNDHTQSLLEIQSMVQKMNAVLYTMENSAKNIAHYLAKPSNKDNALLDMKIQQELRENPSVFAIKIAYAPFQFKKELQLFAPDWVRRGQEVDKNQLEKLYDYTLTADMSKVDTSWYIDTLTSNKSQWKLPYIAKEYNKAVFTYTEPFYDVDDTKKAHPRGVVAISCLASDLFDILQESHKKNLANIIIVDKAGKIIYHPEERYMRNYQDIFTVEEKHRKSEVHDTNSGKSLSAAVKKNLSSLVDTPLDIYTETISTTGWVVGASFFADAYMVPVKKNINNSILLLLSWVFGILAIVTFICHKGFLDLKNGLLLGTGMVFFINVLLWTMLYNRPFPTDQSMVVINNQSNLNKFLSDVYQKALSLNIAMPRTRKLGVQVNAVNFPAVDQISVQATVWQKYDVKADKDFIPAKGEQPDIVIIDAVKEEFSENYRKEENGVVTISWDISFILNQYFDYAQFPLNQESIVFHMRSKDPNKKILLVPDFEAYAGHVRNKFPWINDNLVVPGLKIQDSFFAYQPSGLTNVEAFFQESLIDDLVIDIVLYNNFIDSFIIYISPLLISFMAIFAIFWLQQAERIPALLGVLLTVVFVQQAIRSSIKVTGISYLEYFFFLFYLTLIVAIVYSVFVLKKARGEDLEHKTMKYVKTGYWLIEFLMWFMLTAWVFYNY